MGRRADFNFTDEGPIKAIFKISPPTVNYELLIRKPKINHVELVGDKSLEDLGITAAIDDAVSQHNSNEESHPFIINKVEDEAQAREEADSILQGQIDLKADKDEIKDGILTVKRNDVTLGTFSANSALNKSINIKVPEKTSDIDNDSDYQTGEQVNQAIEIATQNFVSIGDNISVLNNDADYQSGEQVNQAIEIATQNFVSIGDDVSILNNDADYQTGEQVNFAITIHNTSGEAHEDMRQLISDNTDAISTKIGLADLSSEATGLNYNNTTGVFSLDTNYVIPTQSTLESLQRNYTFAELGITKTTSSYSTIDLAKEIAALQLPMSSTLFGEVRVNDMPTGIGNAEMKVEVQQRSGSSSVLAFTLTSTNVAPHEWEFYWVGTSSYGSPSTTSWYATVREDMVLTRTNTSPYSPSGNYNPATKKYVDDSIGNGTLTIQVNSTDITTFSANQTSNTTANIEVPDSATWGNITGTLSNQTDLQDALNAKQGVLTPADGITIDNDVISGSILQGDISDINALIPAQATTSNQLADKDFVNSSISTNTANFIGTFIDVPSLEAYSGTVTNNDYAFVVNSVVTDNGNDWTTLTALNGYDKALLTNFDYAWVVNGSNFDLYRFDILNQEWVLRLADTPKAGVTLNTAYNRYKATVSAGTTTWEWEYTLNNSSFTAAQWAAINSGATTTNIGQIAINTASIGTLAALTTTVKSSLVEAINEVNGTAGSKVSDVQVNSTSVVTNGVANIPKAELNGTYGVVKLYNYDAGLTVTNNGLAVLGAADFQITGKTATSRPIMPGKIDLAVKTGVTTNTLALSSAEKAAANSWLGSADMERGTSDPTASTVGTLGLLYKNTVSGALFQCTGVDDTDPDNIVYTWKSVGTLTDVQINSTSIVTNGIATIPLAELNGEYGLVKLAASSSNFGLAIHGASGTLYVMGATDTQITNKQSTNNPILPGKIDLAVKTGLTTNTLTLDATEKTSANTWLGSIQGVQINNTDLTVDANNKVNIPIMSSSLAGVAKPNTSWGISVNGEYLRTVNASQAEIAEKTNQYKPIVPNTLDYAVKVGVTSNTNVLTTAEKTAASNWILPTQSANTVLMSDGVSASWDSPIVFCDWED